MQSLGGPRWLVIGPVLMLCVVLDAVAILAPIAFALEIASGPRHPIDSMMGVGLTLGALAVFFAVTWFGGRWVAWMVAGELVIRVHRKGLTTHRRVLGRELSRRELDLPLSEVRVRPIESQFVDGVCALEAWFADGRGVLLAVGPTELLRPHASSAPSALIRLGRPLDGRVALERLIGGRMTPREAPERRGAPSTARPSGASTGHPSDLTIELPPAQVLAAERVGPVLLVAGTVVLALLARPIVAVLMLIGAAVWQYTIWLRRHGHVLRVDGDSRRFHVEGPEVTGTWSLDELANFVVETWVYDRMGHVAYALVLQRLDDTGVEIRTSLPRAAVAQVAGQLRVAAGFAPPPSSATDADATDADATDAEGDADASRRFLVADGAAADVPQAPSPPRHDASPSEAWIELDAVPEGELAPAAADAGRGDRVRLVEGGLLHGVGGRATFVRWSHLLGVIEHEGAVYLLAPRRPPAPPWLVVHAGMLPDGGRTPSPASRRGFERAARAGGWATAPPWAATGRG